MKFTPTDPKNSGCDFMDAKAIAVCTDQLLIRWEFAREWFDAYDDYAVCAYYIHVCNVHIQP